MHLFQVEINGQYYIYRGLPGRSAVTFITNQLLNSYRKMESGHLSPVISFKIKKSCCVFLSHFDILHHSFSCSRCTCTFYTPPSPCSHLLFSSAVVSSLLMTAFERCKQLSSKISAIKSCKMVSTGLDEYANF